MYVGAIGTGAWFSDMDQIAHEFRNANIPMVVAPNAVNLNGNVLESGADRESARA